MPLNYGLSGSKSKNGHEMSGYLGSLSSPSHNGNCSSLGLMSMNIHASTVLLSNPSVPNPKLIFQ